MPKKGHVFSPKEHRQVEHIKQSEVERGITPQEAERVGYATVTKRGGSKHAFTDKERRQAEHIMESEEARGVDPGEAKSIAYASVNKHKGRK